MDITAFPTRCVPVPAEDLAVSVAQAEASVAFEALVVTHRRRVFGLLLGHTGHPDEAEDLMQEVFLRAWRAREQLRPRADPWPWLATIAINASRDAARKRRCRPSLTRSIDTETEQMATSMASPRQSAEGRENLDRVRAALAELPERQREVMTLHAFGGLTIPETAKVLGLRPNTVRVNLHHARKRLRQILERSDDDVRSANR